MQFSDQNKLEQWLKLIAPALVNGIASQAIKAGRWFLPPGAKPPGSKRKPPREAWTGVCLSCGYDVSVLWPLAGDFRDALHLPLKGDGAIPGVLQRMCAAMKTGKFRIEAGPPEDHPPA